MTLRIFQKYLAVFCALFFIPYLVWADDFIQLIGYQSIKAELDLGESEGNFKEGQLIKLIYKLKNTSPASIKGNVSGTISLLGEKVVHRFQQYVEISPQQTVQLTFEYRPNEAGLYFAYLRLRNVFGNLVDNSTLLGYALDKIQSPITRKEDFDSFWQKNLQELANIPPNFKITKKTDLCTSTYNVFLIEMQSVGNQLIKAWYRVPVQVKGKIPVILQLPSLGGSLYNIKSLEERPKYGIPYDFAVLSLNIRGHGNSKGKLDFEEDYFRMISYGLENKETYFYRGAILDCIRAIDFLMTRFEIDKSKIVVEGASQGGALALITAALDKRIALCAPDVPFLSNVENLVKSARWVGDELNRYVKAKKTTTFWRLLYNLSYFDTKNFADKIQVPILMSVGLQDWTCPASTCWATYNKIQSEKDCIVYPEGRHEGGGATHRKHKFEWIRAQLKM